MGSGSLWVGLEMVVEIGEYLGCLWEMGDSGPWARKASKPVYHRIFLLHFFF